MAKMLRDIESTDRHLNRTRRHQRLCRKVKGAEKYATAIDPVYRDLQAKQQITIEKINAREDSFDDLLLADTDLDNGVRTAHEKCKQYDRDYPTAVVLTKVFPTGTFTPIIDIERTEEPDAVEQLAVRFESLGEQHPLYQVAADLRVKIKASREAVVSFNEAVRQQKLAEAEEEITQATLRRKYESNYFDARKEFGKTIAERLFPQVTASITPDDSEETESQPTK